MASGSSSQPTTISASAYVHLAPPSAQTSFTPEEVRQLVLEYLCSCCYANSARAFAREVEAAVNESGKSGQLVLTNGAGTGEASASTNGVVRESSSGSGAASTSTNGLNGVNGVNGASASGKRREDSAGHGIGGMDGVEATPPPEDFGVTFDRDGDFAMDDDEVEDDDEMDEELEVESALRVHSSGTGSTGTHGKAVTFDQEEDDDEEDMDEDMPMLSVAQLKEVRLRRDIRDHILSGRIQIAVEMLKEHYPSVLSTPPPPPSSTSATSKSSSSSPLTDPRSPLSFFLPSPPPLIPSFPASSSATSAAATPTHSGSSLQKPSSVPILGSVFSPLALSLRPEILALNLELQSFVELIRTANSASSPSTPTSSDSPSDGGMSGSTSSLASNSTNMMMKAIAYSQALRTKVLNMPQGKERDFWEQECVEVSGLMAYKDLAVCPVRGYLSQSRRETLAELVNAAVLQHSNHTPMPLMALVARQTSATWSTLAELKVPFPPSATSNGSKERSRSKVAPKFDLHTFLTETEKGGTEVPVASNGTS